MNPILDKITSHRLTAIKAEEYYRFLEALCQDLVFTGPVEVNISGQIPWFHVHNREDLQTLLSLGPGLWSKCTSTRGIAYSNQIGDYSFTIYAEDAALPPTCRIIEEEITYPAQPARTERVTKVVCSV